MTEGACSWNLEIHLAEAKLSRTTTGLGLECHPVTWFSQMKTVTQKDSQLKCIQFL